MGLGPATFNIFINELGNGNNSLLVKLADSVKLKGVLNISVEKDTKKALEVKNMGRLEGSLNSWR